MIYAIVNNGAIAAHGPATALWPDTSFAASGPNASFLVEQSAVLIRSDAAYDPETEILQSVEPYLLNGVVFNTVAVPIPEPHVVPQWVQFATALSADASVTEFILTVAAAAPMLDRMLTVGMGQAAQGDPKTFGAAWTTAATAGLVSPELVEHMQEVATTYNLPAEFIAGLAQ